MTSDLMRTAVQNLRNALRRHDWAERWRAKFGVYPPSYVGGPPTNGRLHLDAPGDLRARVAAARTWAPDHDDSCGGTMLADVLPLHPERHGNLHTYHIPRHRLQRVRGRQPEPPEAA